MQKLSKDDFERIESHSSLEKFRKRADGSLYTGKSLVVSENYPPESHPIITTLEKIMKVKHPCLPQCFGYFVLKNQGFDEIIVLLEYCESTLAEFLAKRELSSAELKGLLQQIVEITMILDRDALVTPAYITPYNILITTDMSGKLQFKLFGIIPYNEERMIPSEELRWTAPELFERQSYKKIHININPEKALFYSIGILFIYAALKQFFITEGRELYSSSEFPNSNPAREQASINECLQKLRVFGDGAYFEQVLSKFLTYNHQSRPDFRIWRLSGEGANTGANRVVTNSKQKVPVVKKPIVGHDQIPFEVTNPKDSVHKKKKSCCNIF